jgi:hypothetical protein
MTTLTLKIEGPPGRVPASALASVLSESLKILDDLRERARDEAVTWYVTDLKIASATAALSADDVGGVPLRVASEYVNGVRVAELGEALPPYFSDTSLGRLQRMTKPLGSQNAQYLDVSIGQNGSTQSARATGRTADNIRQLRSPRSRAIGSITGILDTISVRTNAKFQVVDPVSNRPVTCYFPKDRKEAVTNALERRVIVSGVVVRNAKGQPVRVDEAEFEILPEAPPLVGLVGLDADFTGGLSLHDYMERICS